MIKLAFVTNEDPSLNLVFFDKAPRGFTNLDHPVIVDLEGTFGGAAFRPLFGKGDAFSRALYVGAGINGDTPVYGRAALQPLLDLCRAQLSYVCVLDEDGNRWFASVDVIDAANEVREAPYVATVQVRELTKTPSTPDVTP